MSKKYILAVMTALTGIAIAALVGIGNSSTPQVACTMEAKICPDGTSVGRTGPSCEFAACPIATTTKPTQVVPIAGDVVLGVGEKGSVGGLTITFNSVVQDSRCPANVQCIWAGQLKVSVTLATATKTETREMVFAEEPSVFEGRAISVVTAPDVPKSDVKTSPNYYRLGFTVSKSQGGVVGL